MEYNGGCAIYKCRMCGKKYWNTHVPNMLTAAICITVDTPLPREWGGGGLNLVGVHICIEKNNTAICLGIGDLIGFEEKDNRVK